MTLAEQTTRRLERAGIAWDDPGLVRIRQHNREQQLRAELEAARKDVPTLEQDCRWPSCPRHGRGRGHR